MKIQTRKLRIIISSNFFQDIISKEAVNNQKLSIPGNTHWIMSQRRKPEGKGKKKQPTNISDIEIIRYGI